MTTMESNRTAANGAREREAEEICTACGATVHYLPGVGLVDAVSGDDGGTYDICPARYDEATNTQGPHTLGREV